MDFNEEDNENSEYEGLGGPTINGAEEEQQPDSQEGEKGSGSKKTEKAKEAVEVAKKSKEVASKGKATATLAGPIVTVLTTILLIILAIIIVVGFICFFIFMPGQVIAKLNELGTKFLDEMQSLIEGEQEVVHSEEIANVANYLEQMGYDLKGEGFVSGDVDNYILEVGTSNPEGIYRDDDR